VAFFRFFVPRYEIEVTRLNESKLETVAVVVDKEVLETLDSLYMRIIGDGFDMAYFAADNREPRDDIYRVHSTHRRLADLATEYPDMIESIAIYHAKPNLVNSSRGFWLLDPSHSVPPFRASSWLTDPDTFATQEWIRAEAEKSYSYVTPEREPVIVLARSVPRHSGPGFRLGTVFFSVRAAYLEQIVSRYLRHETYALQVMNSDGVVIFESFSGDPQPNSSFGISTSSITSVRSSVGTDWHYELQIPEHVYFERVRRMREIARWLGVGLLAAGILMALIASRRAYRPILSIVDSATRALSSLGWQEGDMPEDDYKFLRSTFGRLSDQVEGLKDRIAESMPLLKQSFYANLLRGVAFTPEGLEEKRRFLSIQKSAERYSVILVAANLSRAEVHSYELIKLAVIQNSENVSRGRHSVYALEYELDRLAIVVNHDDKRDVELIVDVTQSVLSMKMPFADLHFHIAVGVAVDSLNQLHSSLHTAEQALEYSFIYPDRSVLRAVDLLTERKEDVLPAFFDVREFTKLVRTLDLDGISSYLDELMVRLYEEHVSVETARHIVMEILAAASLVMRDWKISHDEESLDKRFEECASSPNLTDFRNGFILLVESIKTFVQRQRKHFHDSLISEIQDYVRGNLQNDLSLRAIAERFHVSYSHLSHLFKEVSTQTFSRFVMECRLLRAKDLLEEQTLNIDQIADATGFGDSGYFIRKFKVRYGLTPGEFKLKASIESLSSSAGGEGNGK